MLISVVIPVYNSEPTLQELIERVTTAVETITGEFEIVLIDDCSHDGSWKRIAELGARNARLRGYRLTKNFGQHAASLCGISQTTGKWVVTIDDDLQQNPADIPKLFAKAQEGFDIVYGYYKETTHSQFRRVTSEIIRRMFALAIPNLFPYCSSFRVVEGTVARSLSQFDSPYAFVDGFLSWLTQKYAVIPVEHTDRRLGTSNYNFRKLAATAIHIFVTFSDLPLKLASALGFFAFAGGMALFFLVVLQKLIYGIAVSGYASIMGGILVFGGLQLLILGIFGEYIGQINFRVARKPMYVIASRSVDALVKHNDSAAQS